MKVWKRELTISETDGDEPYAGQNIAESDRRLRKYCISSTISKKSREETLYRQQSNNCTDECRISSQEEQYAPDTRSLWHPQKADLVVYNRQPKPHHAYLS